MQYKETVMQRLSEIKNKKILLIVAHPDDETLWFFQSIKHLKTTNEVTVFCLTHAAISKRGKELTKVADDLGLKVIFGHCEDTGIDHFLKISELKQAYIKVFSKYKIDLAITHPPHGGEKPHPHHIQLNQMTKEFCKDYSAQFGFFCEQKLLAQSNHAHDYEFNLKKKKYVAHRLLQGYRLLNKKEKKFIFFIKIIFTMLFNFKRYDGFEAAVNLEEKHLALAIFESQQDILKSYNAFYKKSEYLFIETVQGNVARLKRTYQYLMTRFINTDNFQK